MTVVHDLTPLLEQKREQITEWMSKKRSEIPIPIYGSVDIRDAGWKIAVVDANHFPAGFNNISEEDKPPLAQLLRNHINREYNNCQWVHLYPESHTRNKGYIENISALKELLLLGGFDCTVGSLDFDDIGHSDPALSMLEKYVVGELEGYTPKRKKTSDYLAPLTMTTICIIFCIIAFLAFFCHAKEPGISSHQNIL